MLDPREARLIKSVILIPASHVTILLMPCSKLEKNKKRSSVFKSYFPCFHFQYFFSFSFLYSGYLQNTQIFAQMMMSICSGTLFPTRSPDHLTVTSLAFLLEVNYN